MMFTIGAFIILLAFLMDDVTSYVTMSKGWGVLETNPFFLEWGFAGMFGATIVLYIFIVVTWKWIIKMNRVSINKNHFHKKWYDVFVFFYCFMIISIATTKIMIGFGTIDLIVDYSKGGEFAEKIDNAIEANKEYRQTEPEKFNQKMTEHYKERTLQVSYAQQIINVLLAFLLFKIGNKTSPWDLA